MIDPQRLTGLVVDTREVELRREDTLLFALACGLGADPLDPRQLRYVYEDQLMALPALSLVLASPGFWLRDPLHGADWQRVLHAQESFVIHQPLPTAGRVAGRTVVTRVVDRGPGKGALVYSAREIRQSGHALPLATVESCTLLRNDGGCGGDCGPAPAPPALPTRAPDLVCDLPSLPQQALLYRLCGDLNPLHADPGIARAAGFERPLLHGRCTMAIAQHALLRSCCDYDAHRLRAMRVRFSAPFFPGETLRTSIWREGEDAWFTATALERGVRVLNHGHAVITAGRS